MGGGIPLKQKDLPAINGPMMNLLTECAVFNTLQPLPFNLFYLFSQSVGICGWRERTFVCSLLSI